MRMKRLIIWLVVLVVLAVVVVLIVNATNGSRDHYSQLTGLKVSAAEARRPVLGVMIENSPDARPQTGLGEAGIVLETVTEGGITRQLALYQENMPSVIGPVRSLRPYFVDWALGFDAAVAHVGGSPAALQMADRLQLKDLDQFKHGGPYYRDNKRQPPHNMYARSGALQDLEKDLGYGKSQFSDIPRKKDNPAKSASATKILVDFSGPAFQEEFRYKASSNSYAIYLAGKPRMDAANDKPVSVKNVIVLKMSGKDIAAVGSGEAVVFYDGTATKARWQQKDHHSRLEITDRQGKQVALNRGTSWIAVLPGGQALTY